RGEIALVIAPPQREASDAEPAETGDLLRDALARGSVKDAVAEVATLTGRSRRELYRQELALREGSRHHPADRAPNFGAAARLGPQAAAASSGSRGAFGRDP